MKTFEDQWEGSDKTHFFIQGWEPDERPRAAIALVHGLGEHTSRYAHVGRAMTAAGYALLGFDLRGHGRSGGARGHAPSLEAYLEDIGQFVQWVDRRYPDLPRFLYGHSLGALLALPYAIQHGRGLRGVVVSAAPLRDALQEQKAKLALVKVLGRALPRTTIASGLDVTTLSRDLQVVQAYQADPLVHDRITFGWGLAALRAVEFCFAHAREFPVPLLMLHGGADRLAFPNGSEEFAEQVRAAGGDVTLKVWDHLYHEIHNEPEQAEVFQVMLQWLDQHL